MWFDEVILDDLDEELPNELLNCNYGTQNNIYTITANCTK